MIAAVLRTSWDLLRRDRSALALSYAVPIVFFSIFAVIFGSQGNDPTNRVRVLVVDEDGSERAARFITALDAEPPLDVRRAPRAREGEPAKPDYDRAAAEAEVRAGHAPVALVVPKGFGAAELAFGPGAARPRLELLADPSDPIAPKMVEGLLQKTVMTGAGDLSLEVGIRSLEPFVGFTPQQRARLGELVASARAGSSGSGEGAAGALPVEIVTTNLLGGERENPLVAFYAAGLGVMFLLFTAAGAGGAIIEEAESGTLDRLLATRITMTELLAGKLLYLAALGVSQLVVMFVWGWLVFGLDLPGHLAGFGLMAVPTALVSSAFGLVLAALCRTRKQLVAASNLVILSISALGGSMFPRFLMPEALQRASLVAFNSWALEGFLDVFWREAPLVEALPEVAVLLAWTMVFFAVARRIARKWEAV